MEERITKEELLEIEQRLLVEMGRRYGAHLEKAAAARRARATGESQMPTTRGCTADRASVTMPAGLVKLISQACGATSAMVRANSSETGMLRSA